MQPEPQFTWASLPMAIVFFAIVGVIVYAFIRSQKSGQPFIDVLKAVVTAAGMAVAGWLTGLLHLGGGN